MTMITLELNTMHWTGLTELTFKDCVPLVSLNEDYAALLVRNDATWQSLDQLESEVRNTPKHFTASGTAVGGAWHLALAGWLIAAESRGGRHHLGSVRGCQSVAPTAA